MQFKTKLGLVDIPNEDVMAASRDIAGSAGSTPVIAAPSGSLSTGDLFGERIVKDLAWKYGWPLEISQTKLVEALDRLLAPLAADALDARSMIAAGEYSGARSLLWDMARTISSPNIGHEPRAGESPSVPSAE